VIAAPLVSVIVPVLGEARALPGLLDHLAALPGRWEPIVVDGGSTDGTPELAASHPLGARVIRAPRGRGAQMNAGAVLASGVALLFLHADTRLPAGAHGVLDAALGDPRVLGGDFALRFDGDDRLSAVLAVWRRAERCAGVYYGDSAIWLRRETFVALGGYRRMEIMEDYDLARRLERHARRRGARTACLPGPAITSARRWRAHGTLRTIALWTLIRRLYLFGIPASRLARLYRHAR
jgi:rSAM/selenodomain-associated transferase 2